MDTSVLLRLWKAVVPLVLAFGSVSGCSNSSVATNPSPVKCQLSVTIPSCAIPAAGGTGSVSIATTAECAWTAASSVAWITGLSPTSGQGAGTVQFQVSANQAATTRTGTITLNDATASVTQAGSACNFSLNPTNHDQVNQAGATGTISVIVATGCTWTASTSDSWISVTSGASGNGNGTVTYSVSPNSGAARTGAVLIGGQSFAVSQTGSGASTCQLSLQPAALSIGTAGGASTIVVNTTAGCPWSVVSHAGWLTVVGQGAGIGNGSFTINVAANTGSPRVGTLAIAGLTLQVSQAGNCTVAISPANQSVAAAGGQAASISVSTNAGCAWTATTAQSWISVTSGASGSGAGRVDFTVAANIGPARTGTLTIGGQTHTVNQGNGCSFSVSPTTLRFASDPATSAPISVATGAGCSWSAVSNDSWITIDSGASGVGPGQVVFSVTRNNGNNDRSGTLTIAGLTFTVTQDRK